MPEWPHVFQQALRDDMPVLQYRDGDTGEEGHRADGHTDRGGPVPEGREPRMRLGGLRGGTPEGKGLPGDGGQELRRQGGRHGHPDPGGQQDLPAQPLRDRLRREAGKDGDAARGQQRHRVPERRGSVHAHAAAGV